MKLSLDHFNGSGKIIARAIGVHAAYKLLEEYGGQTFYVCLNPNEHHAASNKLGLEVHKVLSDLSPNNHFELPMVTFVQKKMRNDELIADAKHMSMRELVIKYQITRAAIQYVMREHESKQQTTEVNQQQLNFDAF